MTTAPPGSDATSTPPLEPIAVGVAPRPTRRTVAEALGVVSFLAVATGLLVDEHLALVAGLLAFGGGVGAAVLGGTVIGIVQVVIDPARGVARLATSDGGAVDVPLEAIDRAEAASHLVPRKGGSVTVWKLTLHKRDGGVLDTQIASDEPSARRAADTLEEALVAARAVAPPAGAASPELLAGLRGRGPLRVEVTEPGGGSYRSEPGRGAVSVGWSAATPWVQTAIAVGLIGGFWQIARGLAPAEGGGMTAFAWVLAAITAVPIVLFGMSAGVEVRIDLDDAGLTVERRRFGKPFASRRYTIDEVRAIDLSVMSQMTTLVVRAVGEEPPPDLDATDGPVQLATAIARHAGRANQLPLGALTLADGLHLDLALSAELARRKGVDPGTV